MSEELVCPICGIKLNNTRHRGSHLWTAHQIKYSEYSKQQTMNESQKPAEALFSPSIVKESKELIQETAVKIDKSILQEEHIPDRDLVRKNWNPYKELYPDEGNVLNEWL